MSLISIEDLSSLHSGEREPLQTWKWRLVAFPDIGGYKLPPTYCEEITLPIPAFNTNQKEIAGTTVTFPGNTSIDSFEMVLYEDSVISTLTYMQDWQSIIQNPRTGGYRTPSHYWKDLQVELYNIRNEVVANSLIKNAWPVAVSPPQLNQDGSGRLRLNATFACTAQILRPTKRINFTG